MNPTTRLPSVSSTSTPMMPSRQRGWLAMVAVSTYVTKQPRMMKISSRAYSTTGESQALPRTNEFQAFANMLRRRKWIVIVVMLFGGANAFAYASFQKNVYQASALMRVDTAGGAGSPGPAARYPSPGLTGGPGAGDPGPGHYAAADDSAAPAGTAWRRSDTARIEAADIAKQLLEERRLGSRRRRGPGDHRYRQRGILVDIADGFQHALFVEIQHDDFLIEQP